MLCGHYVCYAFSRGFVTEINDNTVQKVLSQTVFENIASGGCLFFYRKSEHPEKGLAENFCEMQKAVLENQVINEEAAIKTTERGRRKLCAPMQSYECVTFEDYPLRFYDDGKTPKFITTTDLNMCLLERFKKV